MLAITDTLVMGSLVSCFQDVLIHGQDIRSVWKSIGDINPDYQVFSDTGSFTSDDCRKTKLRGLGGIRPGESHAVEQKSLRHSKL
jgi:hypothetical protein